MRLEDRMVYQAMVETFARVADGQLDYDVALGFRLDRRRPERFMGDWQPQWARFKQTIADVYQLEGYPYLWLTDVVDYFPSIRHQLLRSTLYGFGADSAVLNGIETLLTTWFPQGRGIPQARAASALLGNLFLYSVDVGMTRAGFRFFRYMDDMAIAAFTRVEAERGLAWLKSLLGRLHLMAHSGSKTKLYSGPEILELAEGRDERLAGIDYELGGRRPKDELMEAENRAEIEVEELSEGTFTRLRKGTLHPWDELQAVVRLNALEEPPPGYLDLCRLRHSDSNTHWSCRSHYIMELARFGEMGDVRAMLSTFEHRATPEEHRALLLSASRLPKAVRNRVINEAVQLFPHLRPAGRYIKAISAGP